MRLRRPVALASALVALASFAPTGDVASASAPAGCATVAGAAVVLDCTVPVPDGLGAIDSRVRVIVPDGYGSAPVPVVYLFHGVGDTYRTWVDNTDVETFAAGLGALVVMPDAGRTPDAGWYSDWADGSRRWETFHIDVLIPWVESTFAVATGREHRAAAGLSMGGFGALSYAGRHPDLFSAAAAFSPLADTQYGGPVSGVGFAAGRQRLGTPDSSVWGDPVTASDEWAAHNPTAIARTGGYDHLAGNLWLATGSGTPGGPAGESTDAAGYGVEHYIWQTNQQLRLALLQSETPFVDQAYPGGYHGWPYWQMALHRALPEVVAAIS